MITHLPAAAALAVARWPAWSTPGPGTGWRGARGTAAARARTSRCPQGGIQPAVRADRGACMVVALVVGAARLLFTGTIQLPISPAPRDRRGRGGGRGRRRPRGPACRLRRRRRRAAVPAAASAVLVVGGWGSSCCDAANGLRAMLPGTNDVAVLLRGPERPGAARPERRERRRPAAARARRQDRRPGAGPARAPRASRSPSSRRARAPSASTRCSPATPGCRSPPWSCSARSSARAAHLPAGPGRRVGLRGRPRRAQPPGRRDVAVRPGRRAASCLLGQRGSAPGTSTTWSPRRAARADGKPDALARRGSPRRRRDAPPGCALPSGVIVVPAFHGGLLGDPTVLPMVSSFLAGRDVSRRRRPAARGRRADHRRGRRLADARDRLGLPLARQVAARLVTARLPARGRRPTRRDRTRASRPARVLG